MGWATIGDFCGWRFVLWFLGTVERRPFGPVGQLRACASARAPNRRDNMLASSKGALAGAIAALTVVAALALATDASAQTAQNPVHRKVHAAAPRPPKILPVAPGTELSSSASAAEGSENHYFSDTVGSSYTDLTDQTFRYGQSVSPRFDAGEPLFRF
jgi:hypothetical protein